MFSSLPNCKGKGARKEKTMMFQLILKSNPDNEFFSEPMSLEEINEILPTLLKPSMFGAIGTSVTIQAVHEDAPTEPTEQDKIDWLILECHERKNDDLNCMACPFKGRCDELNYLD
jgi:NAD-dependent SIR2 family protein deacetylase